MQPYATPVDVEENWRGLAGQETTNAESWLRAASAQLRIQVPNLDIRIAADPSLEDLVRNVVTMAVIRMLRGGDRYDPSTNADVYFTTAELGALAVGGTSVPEPQGCFPVPVPLPAAW